MWDTLAYLLVEVAAFFSYGKEERGGCLGGFSLIAIVLFSIFLLIEILAYFGRG